MSVWKSINRHAFVHNSLLSENATKSLYRLQQIRTADRQYKLKQLTNDEVGSHKYRKCITATFSNGAFSIYLFGLNERQNRVRVQFNPNTVGLANAIAVFNDIRQMVGKSDYDMCISNSKVTRVDYTLDIPVDWHPNGATHLRANGATLNCHFTPQTR